MQRSLSHWEGKLVLKSGKEVGCRWDFPGTDARSKIDQASGPVFPLAFLVPSEGMEDLNGNGQGYPVRDTLRDLSNALIDRGIATFRYASRPLLNAQESVEIFDRAIRHRFSKEAPVALVGVAEGADLIAKEFYSFYRVRFPHAAVLISAAVTPLHLNNLTCPYLLLHGGGDPLFKWSPYSRFEEAVHHHQYRFGDRTSHVLIENLGRELGEPYLDPRVTSRVADWLAPAIREGLRPQEPAAA